MAATWPTTMASDREEPDEAHADDADIDLVPARAEEVPAEVERIGQERPDGLALDQQIGQVMRQVIGDRRSAPGTARSAAP